jgi:uncharacterized Tic20 family protein
MIRNYKNMNLNFWLTVSLVVIIALVMVLASLKVYLLPD